MGRKKTAPPDIQELSESAGPATASANEIESQTPSASQSSSSTSSKPICPQCHSKFAGLSITELDDHVKACTSTAGAASSDSPLSSPPHSPSQLLQSSVINPVDGDKEEVTEPEATAQVDPTNEESPAEEVPQMASEDPIRPYVDSKKVFEYYDSLGDEEIEEPETGDSEAAEKPPDEAKPADSDLMATETEKSGEENSSELNLSNSSKSNVTKKPARHPFAKLTPVEVFEEQLKDTDNMTYDELYDITDKVSRALFAYQAEWDEIEKETNRHEALEKAEKKRLEESAKQLAEEAKSRDDEARGKVQVVFQVSLKLKGQEWTKWLAAYERDNPDSDDIRHLQNLKNPQFMALANKKKRGVRHKEDNYEDLPIVVEQKISKEELNIEKRKRGRLIDPVKFNDMKEADVYGNDYSSHPKHYGSQPKQDRAQKRKSALAAEEEDTSAVTAEVPESGRIRVQRKSTKRAYETDLSGSAESEEEGLPAKRARRPKVFEDVADITGRSRTQSRSGTPGPVRTFASGKRIGRPPKSKLQAVQMASESPEGLTNGIENPEGQANDNAAQELQPLQEEQLHDAAEALVNQAASDKRSPPVKKKHAGGRPRKNAAANASASGTAPLENTTQEPVPVAKPRNKGGRPRKNPIQAEAQSEVKMEPGPQSSGLQFGEGNGVMQSTEQVDGAHEPVRTSSGRPKRKRTTVETDESPLVVDSAQHHIENSPTPKKRKTRPAQQITEDAEFVKIPEKRQKRRRDATLSEARDTNSSETEAPAKKRKNNAGTSSDPNMAKEEPKNDGDHVGGVDGSIDESLLTAEEREALRLDRVKKEKSRKLSESMKARWASGGMKEAQETRKANNALKKAAKQASEASGTAPFEHSPIVPAPIPPPVLVLSIPPKPINSKKPGGRKAKAKEESPPPPPMPSPLKAKRSTRKRNPSNWKLGFDGEFDGADDWDDESEFEEESNDIKAQTASQYESTYHEFQAITSPGGQVALGKRKRKSIMNLKALMGDETDDDDDSGSF